MKTLLMPTVALLCLASTPAGAQVCRWKDADGRVQYSDRPPPGVTCEGQVRAPRAAAPPAPPAAEAKVAADGKPGAEAGNGKGARSGPRTPEEQDADFRKRRTERQEAERKAEQEKARAADKRAACDNARNRLTGLRNGGRFSRYDSSGQLVYLNEEEIARETTRAEREVTEACK